MFTPGPNVKRESWVYSVPSGTFSYAPRTALFCEATHVVQCEKRNWHGGVHGVHMQETNWGTRVRRLAASCCTTYRSVELVVGRETNVLDVAVGVNVVRVANVPGVTHLLLLRRLLRGWARSTPASCGAVVHATRAPGNGRL